MALNEKELFIPRADQTSTVGAAMSGDVVATIPADYDAAKTALSGLTGTGYISEAGVTVSRNMSLTDFREMNRGIVRRGVDSVDGTISYSELQFMNSEALKKEFGDSNVTTSDDGKKVTVKVGTELPSVKTHAFKLKDGDVRAILWVPRGQVTGSIDMTFAANSMAELPIEVSCYDDGTGHLFYIFFEDESSSKA